MAQFPSVAFHVIVQPALQVADIIGEPLDVVRHRFQRFRAVHRSGTRIWVLREEGFDLVQLRLRRERLRDRGYQRAEVSVVQGVSADEELPVRANPVPDYRSPLGIRRDGC